MFNNQWARVALLTMAIALTAAACGSSTTTSPTDTGQAEPAPTGGELPVADTPDDDGPAVASTCLAGEPDCQYKGAADEDVRDLPPPIDAEPEPDSAGGTVSSGMLVDGGLSVAEALETDATGVIAIRGFIVADAGSARLCELLAESLPPQCGGASIVLAGFTADGLAELPDDEALGLETAQGITWTNQSVSFFGELVDGEFVIDPLVAG